jgi:CheY-like chemotaxis protein
VATIDQKLILLADDSAEDRILIPRAIKKAELPSKLICFEDGEQALEYLAGAGKFSDRVTYPLPSLVLLDIKMPKCDGFEVLEWIRKHIPDRIPVVMLTSSNMEEDIRKAERLGADSYFVKPARFTELIEMIRTLQARETTSGMQVNQRAARFI